MAAYRRHTQRSERRPIHGGTSQPRRYIPRDRQLGHGLIMSNYFDPGARYTEEMFRRRYRMKKSLFLKMMQDVCNKDVYFQQRQDATGRWGCTPEQKLTSVMRMLSAGYSADPKWATLIQTITNPVGEASQLFARYQESYRKDVERAFGILRARWEILKKPAKGWKANDLGYIIKTCIILHNMIIEDERPENEDDESDDDIDHVQERISRAVARYDTEPYDGGQSYHPILLEQRLSRVRLIRSTTLHQQLKNDLVQYLRTREGSRGQARRRRRR
ncbi:unnamed protein product [Rhodiola kirilowii]